VYNLLIVDDESEIRNGLANYILWNEFGFQVAGQAENGQEALDFILSQSIDVVLCDIKMPVMSGIELAKELKEKKPKIKVIFLSVYRDFEYAREALVYGVTNYILKPTKYSELAEVFRKVKQELDHDRIDDDEISAGDGCNYNEQIIDLIKDYLKVHYRKTTLEEVGKVVHLNPSYISKFFKYKTGENFSDYLIKIRMKKAAELLKIVDYKIYQISEMVGYSNPKNFTRIFKSYFGKSPRQFRNGVTHNDRSE
jgi:two-component system, response regulator YesN